MKEHTVFKGIERTLSGVETLEHEDSMSYAAMHCLMAYMSLIFCVDIVLHGSLNATIIGLHRRAARRRTVQHLANSNGVTDDHDKDIAGDNDQNKSVQDENMEPCRRIHLHVESSRKNQSNNKHAILKRARSKTSLDPP